MFVSYLTAALYILLCGQVAMVSAASTKVRNTEPFKRVQDDIIELQNGQAALNDAAAKTDRVIKTWNSVLLQIIKCINLPTVDGTSVAMGTTLKGAIYATYSCKSHFRKLSGKTFVSYCNSGVWTSVDIKCTQYKYCYKKISGRGIYSGHMDKTRSGITCQKWENTSPHTHSYTTSLYFKETSGLGPETMDAVSNYCRDPNGKGAPWCYTTDASNEWEFCMIPKC